MDAVRTPRITTVQLKNGKEYKVPVPTIKELSAIVRMIEGIPDDVPTEFVLCDAGAEAKYTRLYYYRYLHRKFGVPIDEII